MILSNFWAKRYYISIYVAVGPAAACDDGGKDLAGSENGIYI